MNHRHVLPWYGVRRASVIDLIAVAKSHEVQVVFHKDFDCPRMIWHETIPEPWVITIPEQFGPLAQVWALAHEVGHLMLHDGPVDRDVYQMQEDEADRWGATALLPEMKIRNGAPPSVEECLRSLSANYQRIPASGGLRRLACRISYARINALKREVA